MTKEEEKEFEKALFEWLSKQPEKKPDVYECTPSEFVGRNSYEWNIHNDARSTNKQ